MGMAAERLLGLLERVEVGFSRDPHLGARHSLADRHGAKRLRHLASPNRRRSAERFLGLRTQCSAVLLMIDEAGPAVAHHR